MGRVSPSSARTRSSSPATGEGYFHSDFVGHDFYEGLVAPDGFARLLKPLADGAFYYGFADVG